MKKALVASIVTMSFLIGCSFSKTKNSNPNADSRTPLSLSEKVMVLDIQKLREELKSESFTTLNTLDKNGNTLLDVAIKRGNGDILNLLLTIGCSPYLPNKEGKSLYNNSHIEVKGDMRSEIYLALRIQEQISFNKIYRQEHNWSSLSNDVNTYKLPCDVVLSRLFPLSKRKFQVTISEFLRSTPNCKYSIDERRSQQFFEDVVNENIHNSLENYFEIVELVRFLPKNIQYLSVRGDDGEYQIHPIIAMKVLNKLNPVKLEVVSYEIEKLITPEDVIIRFYPNNKTATITVHFGDKIEDNVLKSIKEAMSLFYHEELQ